jgi:plastocyanin
VNQTVLAILASLGGLAIIFLAVIGAIATYDALADNNMMDDMGGMMDDGMGGMMDGMMGGGGPETTGSASGRGEVRIENFRFEPTTLNVTPGTVIVWTNQDSAPHTATAKDESFDTGRLGEAEAGNVTFEKPGIFAYICDIHPRMEARIVVGQ